MSATDPIKVEIERAEAALRLLGKTVLEELKPPAGAYAFFYYNGHALASLKDCTNIFRRLHRGRAKLTWLHAAVEKRLAERAPSTHEIPPRLQAFYRQQHEVAELMKLDLETLYLFGNILLDQWALQAIVIGDTQVPKQHPFRELVDHLDQATDDVLGPLWDRTRDDMLWLHYQLRFYRNRFITHANRPWQRGTTASVMGADFNLFTPTPLGWLDDEALDAQIMELMYLAPAHIQRSRADYWERRPARVIEVLFDRIPEYGRTDRERISSLYGKKGGSTPSYHVLTLRLFRFVAAATEALIPIVHTNASGIDLGRPHSTSADLHARYLADASSQSDTAPDHALD